jgi:protein tyrosine phosphatase (PTP) superfamily phosphohydrolase (DUF442 family)
MKRLQILAISRVMAFVAVTCFAGQACRASDTAQSNSTPAGSPVAIDGIQNAFRVTDRIYSGSQPEGPESFLALRKLGVKTIVSVDGSKPDVETARKYGFRYVHLPFGYNGVPTNRIAELAKVTSDLSGPFFVHCHHGKHRGPVAVAIMCEASAGWTPEKGVEFLHQAGTAADYPGLYRSVREFKRPTAVELAAVKGLPELALTPSLVDAMVTIDQNFDRLKLCQAAGWKEPPGHADVSPTHEATMLWEQFKEIARTPDTAKRADEFRLELTEAEKSMDELRNLLKKNNDTAVLDVAFKKTSQSCTACHTKFRN